MAKAHRDLIMQLSLIIMQLSLIDSDDARITIAFLDERCRALEAQIIKLECSTWVDA